MANEFLDQSGADLLDQAGEDPLFDQAALVQLESSVAESLGLSDGITTQWVVHGLDETLGLEATINAGTLAIKITETLGLTDTVAVNFQQSLAIAFALGLDARIAVSAMAYAAVNEGLGLADTIATQQALIESISATIGLEDTITPTAQIVASVAFGLALSDTIKIAYSANMNETLGLTDTLAFNLRYWQSIAEGVGLSTDFADTFICYADVDETVGIEDTMTPQLRLSIAISEGLGLRFALLLENDLYYGHIANAEGAFPESDIQGWTFNSFFSVDGHYYGVNQDGIYELTGNDDDGVDIDLDIMTGMLDMGDGMLTRIEDAELLIATDGSLYMSVRTTVGGQRKEHTYELDIVPGDGPREAVQAFGKGTRGMYWEFRLRNVDGASLDLGSMRVRPVLLTQRRNS